MLRKASTVTTSRDVSRAARTLKRACRATLNASAINVVDLEAQPLPVARFETTRDHYSGGIALRTTPVTRSPSTSSSSTSAAPSCPRQTSASWSGSFPAGIPPGLSRRDRRAQLPAPVVESYTHELLRCVDMSGVREGQLKVVADCAGGTAVPGASQPARHHRRGRAHPEQPAGRGVADRDRRAAARGPAAAGRGGSSSKAAFGVRFDPVGERIQLVDEKGELVSEDRALLAVLDLSRPSVNEAR